MSRNSGWSLLFALVLLVSCASSDTKSAAKAQSSKSADGKGTAVVIMFQPWRDPNEGAFTLNVPQGWQVSGGLVRKASVDVLNVVRATSPDGKIKIMIGDSSVMPHQVPDQMMMQMGMREGQTMPAPWGGQVLLARFQTGEQYSRYYATKICRNPQISHAGPLPQATRDFQREADAYGAATQFAARASVGEANFTCDGQVGYVRTSTLLAFPRSGPGVHSWWVYELSAFQADPSQQALARYVLNTMVASLKMDPRWEAKQAQMTKNVTATVTRAQQQMAATIANNARQQAKTSSFDVMKGWEQRNKIHDAAMERDTQARRGTAIAEDPITGPHTVSNQYNYMWTRPDGSIVGTNTATPPDYNSGWRQMTIK
ncbi:MAG: hypothetical protein ABSD88_13225 [Candidatus Korobacteraceae bacterium]|jgi:hypothetical protein